MNIDTFLKNKGYTVYRLSKETGISKSTLFDIFSGKSNILDCRVRIIMRIAEALNCDIKELIDLEPILYNSAYEENLPCFLKESSAFIKNKRNRNNPLFDCYLDEVNSSINVCEIENLISKKQADYLRNKYLKRGK